jgi:putative tryptophan/tyrosine transport system substrate-binding protein
VRRRDLVAVFGGTMLVGPLSAGAQQPAPMRRIGVLMNVTADHPQGQASAAAFHQALQDFGWTEGRNLQIDYRCANDADRDRRFAAELVALAPDVILAVGTPAVAALQHVTRSLPIVFVQVTDPVGAGFVVNLARPGGNTTGFMLAEYSVAGKWLELLKQVAPTLTRAAVLRDPSNPAAGGQFAAIQALAPPLEVELTPIDVRDAGEIERAVVAFARSPNGGLVVTGSASNTAHLYLIMTLAARHTLPAIYGDRRMVALGGLVSYGPDRVDAFRRAAGYVDRILKGEKPGDLPVQAPTKIELGINLKTAKALGLTLPQSILARADEVIE